MDKTLICTLNLKEEVIKTLNNKGINAYNGSIGNIIKLDYGHNSKVNCRILSNYPKNLHEYNVVILDLTNEKTIDYSTSEHLDVVNKTNKTKFIKCFHPQNQFDPRPLALFRLKPQLNENMRNGLLMIVFSGQENEVEYTFEIGDDYISHKTNTYNFITDFLDPLNKHGIKINVPNNEGPIFDFIKKHRSKLSYDVTFSMPITYEDENNIADPRYIPLAFSHTDEVISFYRLENKSGIFFFPRVDNQAEFIEEFLKEIAPTYLPALFPDVVKNNWINQSRYHLPNHSELLSDLDSIKDEYNQKLELKKQEIQQNMERFSFLTDLLILTGDELVHAVIEYLKWLGFDDAKDVDDILAGNIKEEDIQIETDKGLIIIEVKGIGGTSKDSDCSQIGKIKHRRSRQLKSFDVYAHYIVNHQRHLPAAERNNPPFTEHQISDAKLDERGLITTWQLFNLYFTIERGIITKEQARSCFYKYGYLDFTPDHLTKLEAPKEFFSNNKVVVLDIEGVTLNVNDKLVVRKDEQFEQVNILSMQKDGAGIESCSNGEIGIKFDKAISKTSILYATKFN